MTTKISIDDLFKFVVPILPPPPVEEPLLGGVFWALTNAPSLMDVHKKTLADYVIFFVTYAQQTLFYPPPEAMLYPELSDEPRRSSWGNPSLMPAWIIAVHGRETALADLFIKQQGLRRVVGTGVAIDVHPNKLSRFRQDSTGRVMITNPMCPCMEVRQPIAASFPPVWRHYPLQQVLNWLIEWFARPNMMFPETLD